MHQRENSSTQNTVGHQDGVKSAPKYIYLDEKLYNMAHATVREFFVEGRPLTAYNGVGSSTRLCASNLTAVVRPVTKCNLSPFAASYIRECNQTVGNESDQKVSYSMLFQNTSGGRY